MPSDSRTIATQGLCFSYGSHGVLDGVDFEANAGEVVGIVGPNGSGKSTLIKLLSGVLPDYEGSIRLGGDEVSDIPRREIARRVAVVPQEPIFSFPFTVLEVVLLGRHPHLSGLAFESESDTRLAREALAAAGASELADRTIQQLSSGERQRVVFAKALAQATPCLLLDEPASFLDIRHQVELYDLVRTRAREQDATVVTVLHDLNLAAEYCDRVYLMRAGRIDCCGETAEVFTYANLTRVFETEIYVDLNSVTGKLLIVPLPAAGRR
jgi:iron complex transport system ATP-binding protein